MVFPFKQKFNLYFSFILHLCASYRRYMYLNIKIVLIVSSLSKPWQFMQITIFRFKLFFKTYFF